jgi:peptide/nickel transport system substrate-binding protein
MKPFNKIMASVVMGLAVGLTTVPAAAETPPNILVIATQIDDLTTMDPAQSFEFSGSDVNRNVYSALVNFDPADLCAG